jgi:hypothetical protein
MLQFFLTEVQKIIWVVQYDHIALDLLSRNAIRQKEGPVAELQRNNWAGQPKEGAIFLLTS